MNKNRKLGKSNFISRYDIEPKYLYKIMERKYYDLALRYGDLAFMSGNHQHTCSGENKDDNERRCVLKLRRFGKDYLIGMMCLIYCFTTDYRSYIAKYGIVNTSNYVILRFKYSDVFHYFESLPWEDMFFGSVAYDRNNTVIRRLHQDNSILAKRLYGFNKSFSYMRIKKEIINTYTSCFFKSLDYRDECEYRFVFNPQDNMAYYFSTGLNRELSESDINDISSLGDVGTIFIKWVDDSVNSDCSCTYVIHDEITDSFYMESCSNVIKNLFSLAELMEV